MARRRGAHRVRAADRAGAALSAEARAHEQYLTRHAEPEARGLSIPPRDFGHVVTIPACGEGRALRDALGSVPAGPLGEVLIVLVVNGRADAPRALRDANLAALERLRAECGRGAPLAANAALHEHPRGALLLVDRATPGRELPPRQGVGLARKIAADIALALWRAGRVASPWIHCTDADVELPPRYFDAAVPHGSGPPGAADAGAAARARGGASTRNDRSAPDVALVYPFRHVGCAREALEYEISLRYYVAGLRFAGSPYAFHTVGSALAVHASAYARVRGFPKRLAAEDFYLLDKLAKLGAIRSLGGDPIRLSARVSKRTPFGTGRAIERARRRERATLRAYHPDVFANLGAWLQTLDALAERGAAADPADLLAEQVANWPAADARRMRERLEISGAWAAARGRARRGRSPRSRARHLHGGFDAFQTLKLIHALRAGGLASPPLREALERAPFVSARADAPLAQLREQIAAAEPTAGWAGVSSHCAGFSPRRSPNSKNRSISFDSQFR